MSTITLNKEAIIANIAASTDVNPTIVLAKTLKGLKTTLVNRLIELDDLESKAQAGRIIDNILTTISELDATPSKAAATRVLDGIITNIKTNLIDGNDVMIAGFINLKPAVQAARPENTNGRNPQTGEKMVIAATPAKNKVSLKLTAPFRAELNA